jgi:hypothetical protein
LIAKGCLRGRMQQIQTGICDRYTVAPPLGFERVSNEQDRHTQTYSQHPSYRAYAASLLQPRFCSLASARWLLPSLSRRSASAFDDSVRVWIRSTFRLGRWDDRGRDIGIGMVLGASASTCACPRVWGCLSSADLQPWVDVCTNVTQGLGRACSPRPFSPSTLPTALPPPENGRGHEFIFGTKVTSASILRQGDTSRREESP